MQEYKELWKDIPGYEGLYQAGSEGHIKSLSRKIIRSNGRVQTLRERILVQVDNGSGYANLFLCRGGINSRDYVHRIIAKTFIENPNGYKEVNHINGNKSDNSVTNLEWCSRSQNNFHAYKSGLKIPYERSGINNPNYKHGNRVKQQSMPLERL